MCIEPSAETQHQLLWHPILSPPEVQVYLVSCAFSGLGSLGHSGELMGVFHPQTIELGDGVTLDLRALRDYAIDVQCGRSIDTDERRFTRMVCRLPRGAKLPGWGKRALRVLFNRAKALGETGLQDTLFQLRFDVDLDDEWARNEDPDDVDTLWQLLRELPDSHVEGNVRFRSIALEPGSGGSYTAQTKAVSIGAGALTNDEAFQDVVRHEVGHAVHAGHTEAVDDWLAREFGWRLFAADDEGVEAWAAQMGSFRQLERRQRCDVVRHIQSCLGRGASWTPGPRPGVAADDVWYGRNFGPRLVYEGSPARWFLQSQLWYREEGRAFALNYWYGQPMVVHASTIELVVTAMPSLYALMSPQEFFAEIYALYYDLDDPLRARLPVSVIEGLDQLMSGPRAPKDGRARRRGAKRPPLPDVATIQL